MNGGGVIEKSSFRKRALLSLSIKCECYCLSDVYEFADGEAYRFHENEASSDEEEVQQQNGHRPRQNGAPRNRAAEREKKKEKLLENIIKAAGGPLSGGL
jgi:hypothetical protein